MLHYFKRIRDGVEALPRNWVECGIPRLGLDHQLQHDLIQVGPVISTLAGVYGDEGL